jgi:hypothetical protein
MEEKLLNLLSKKTIQKLKRIKFWKEKYLNALEELKKAHSSLGELISDSETKEIYKNQEVSRTREENGNILIELKSGAVISLGKNFLKSYFEASNNKSTKNSETDLGTINDKNDLTIPKVPPLPKKDESVNVDPQQAKQSFNEQLKKTIREGIKPSDLKKKKQ